MSIEVTVEYAHREWNSYDHVVHIRNYQQLQAKVAELEEENARLKAECDDIKQVQFPRKLEAVAVGWKKKLAAEQLNNKLLREALEAVIKVHGYESGIPVEALAQPSDTSALDAYVAEKVKDVQLQDIEQYPSSKKAKNENRLERSCYHRL